MSYNKIIQQNLIILENEILNRIPLNESFNGKVSIVTHKNPDGDALGSSLGLYRLIKNMNINVSVICPNDFPAFLSWMDNSSEIIIFEKNTELAKEVIGTSDLLFCLDFNALNRIDKLAEHVKSARAFKILIDHHPDPEDFCDISISQISASSTAELVYLYIRNTSLKKYLDRNIAESIFTGVMTDTGCFSFNSSNPDTFRVVAELLELGIHKDSIYSNVYDNYSENRMRLLGHSIANNMKVFYEYKTAYIIITKEEIEKYKFEIGDSEGFVNYPFSIKGIIFTALFTEKKDFVRISFRSKGDFSCNAFARKHFQGGGHKNAAGGESPLPIQDVVKRFESLLGKYKNELNKPFI